MPHAKTEDLIGKLNESEDYLFSEQREKKLTIPRELEWNVCGYIAMLLVKLLFEL